MDEGIPSEGTSLAYLASHTAKKKWGNTNPVVVRTLSLYELGDDRHDGGRKVQA